MIQHITQWLDNGIMILIAVLLLRFYFKPEAKWIYKKKWVLFGCICLILYSTIDLALFYHKKFQSHVPSKAEVEKTILADGVVLSANQLYSSRDGYQVMVPAGYQRVEMKSGAVSLVAAKEGCSMLVALLPISGPLDKTVPQIKQELKSRNTTYVFLAQEDKHPTDPNTAMLEFEATKQGTSLRGFIVMFRRDNKLFQLMLSSKKNMFPSQRAEFEAIIRSFKIK